MGYASKTACAILAILALLPAAPAHAQDSNQLPAAGLTVSPAIFEVVGKPGQTIAKNFHIQNISGSAMPVTGTIDRLRPYEQEIDHELSESFNASQWIKISEPHHILDVKERRAITAVISVPKNAEPGGYYAAILWQPLVPSAPANTSTATIAPKVGILAFITVPGDTTFDIGLSSKTARLHRTNNVPVHAEFSNTGNMHILPTGKVTVKNIFGSTKAELPLKPGIVLPNTKKKFEASWNKPPWFGVYSIETTATYGPDQTPIKSGKKYIIVVQWLPLLLVLPALLAASIFALKTYRRWPAAWHAFKGRHIAQK